MQSPRKTQNSGIPRSIFNQTSQPTKAISKKKSCTTQTEVTVPFLTFQRDAVTEEMKTNYTTAVDYLNFCHRIMNKILDEKYIESGDTTSAIFKMPQVPNYMSLFVTLLSKSKNRKITSTECVNIKTSTSVAKPAKKSGIIEFVPDIKESLEYKLLEEKLKKINGANTNVCPMVQKSYTTTFSRNKTGCYHRCPTDLSPDLVHLRGSQKKSQSQLGSSTEPKLNEPASCQKFCAIKFIKEEIAENKLSEDNLTAAESPLIKNVLDPNLTKTTQIPKYLDAEDSSTKIQKNKSSKTNQLLETKDLIADLIQTQFQKLLQESKTLLVGKESKLEKINLSIIDIPTEKKVFFELPEEPPNLASSNTNSGVIRHNGVKNILLNNHRSCVDSKSACTWNRPSTTTTNTTKKIGRPCTPKKVNELFKKASTDKIQQPKDNKIQQCSSYIQNVKSFISEDDGSIIFDDEEFEKISINKGAGEASSCKDSTVKKSKKTKVELKKNEERNYKNHPLKLNEKDFNKLNQQMITNFGIFTEKGDLKPNVIEILEEKKVLKPKDSRNKRFRAKRQWDVQIHLKPKLSSKNTMSSTTVSSLKSFLSMSSDIKSDSELMALENLKMSSSKSVTNVKENL